MSLIGVKVCENLFMSFILNYGGLIGDFIVVENYLRAVAVEARLEDFIWASYGKRSLDEPNSKFNSAWVFWFDELALEVRIFLGTFSTVYLRLFFLAFTFLSTITSYLEESSGRILIN